MWRQSSLTIGIHMIGLTAPLCPCHNIWFQSTPDRNKTYSHKHTFPRHGAPRDQDQIPVFETIIRLMWALRFPGLGRQTLSLDESSDPGLSLTHHKACQCVTHTEPQPFERIPKRLEQWPHHGQGEEPWISVRWDWEGRYRRDSLDYCSRTSRSHNWTLKCRSALETPGPSVIFTGSRQKSFTISQRSQQDFCLSIHYEILLDLLNSSLEQH